MLRVQNSLKIQINLSRRKTKRIRKVRCSDKILENFAKGREKENNYLKVNKNYKLFQKVMILIGRKTNT